MEDIRRFSKLLSLALRHRPEVLGVELDGQGWAAVAAVLSGLVRKDKAWDLALLQRVVRENNKQRFEFSEDGQRIRARQGHSLPVDLALEPREPPERLFHGTVSPALPAIRREGLRRMARHHVHLSADEATARLVGARRGRPVVLTVRAAELARSGVPFYLSTNGVWLVEHVPISYIDNL